MKFEVHPIAKLEKDWMPLVEAAAQVRHRAYAPYSGFKVASAIEDERGEVHVGVNVENVNYGGTSCAERNATTRMVVEGGGKIRRVVVVTPSEGTHFPCGSCLQALQEFQSDTVVVAVSGSLTRFAKAKLSDLFPAAYNNDGLKIGEKK